MLVNIRLNWDFPSVAANQRALKHSLVEMRPHTPADSFDFSPVGTVLVPESTLLLEGIEEGTYDFRVTAVDVADIAGPPSDTLVFDASAPIEAPGQVTGLTAKLEA